MLHRKITDPDDDDDVHHGLRTMVYKRVFLSPPQLPEMIIVIPILQRTKLGFREWNELPRLIELGAAKLGFEPTISCCQMQQLRDLVSNLPPPPSKTVNLLYLLYSFLNVSHVSNTLLSFLCITSFGSKKPDSISFHKLGQHGKVNEPAQSCTLLSGRARFGPSIWLQGPPS